MEQDRKLPGCLLIGQTDRMRRLERGLNAMGMNTLTARREDRTFDAVRTRLCAVRGREGVCIAAEGEFWAAAMALAVQLCVDRIVLIAPVDDPGGDPGIARLRNFALRNLFFCVSDVLVLDGEQDVRSGRGIDRMCRRLCNARVRRASLTERMRQTDPMELAARFLTAGGSAL